MDLMHLLLIALTFVVPVAVFALMLFFVIRWAVLSALRTHAAELTGTVRS
jgi:hypothetical protein